MRLNKVITWQHEAYFWIIKIIQSVEDLFHVD